MTNKPDNLYQGFKLTTDNCDAEPIHRPLFIQGTAHLMVLDANNPSYIYASSAGLQELLNVTEEAFWQAPVNHWMPEQLLAAVEDMQKLDFIAAVDPKPVVLDGRRFNVLRHIHNERLILEFEQKIDSEYGQYASFRHLAMVFEPIKKIAEVEPLFQTFAQKFKEITGYDRVMIYKFDEHHHGQVIGEARETHLEPFLGMHFPATDIPKIARDLFLLNRSRIITSIHIPNKPIIHRPDIKGKIPGLDLTYSHFRGTSPIHVEYLKNMGVVATANFSLVKKEKLWGLISCHHYSPKFIPYELRKTGEIIANLFMRKYEQTQNYHNRNAKAYKSEVEKKLIEKLDFSEAINIQLIQNKPDLLELCDADGAAILGDNDTLYVQGETPDKRELLLLGEWLSKKKITSVYETHNFNAEAPEEFIPDSMNIGGLLVVSISEESNSFIIWFRKPQSQIVNWGGNPEEAILVSSDPETGEMRISPRKSFAKWQEKIEKQSIPWPSVDLEAADRLHVKLLSLVFQRSAEKVKELNKEFEELTYVASHDLREPLKTISNYLNLLDEEIETNSLEENQRILGKCKNGISRMENLVLDLLMYSRAGSENDQAEIDLNVLIRNIEEDYTAQIKKMNGKIIYPKLPIIIANETDMRQLFQNLISNGLKYAHPERDPVIRITCENEGFHNVFRISDNCIGIQKKYFKKIFKLFTRLHRKNEYEGTGIGLSHCKKIVESMDGSLAVESEFGEGSTFIIKIHESKFLENGMP